MGTAHRLRLEAILEAVAAPEHRERERERARESTGTADVTDAGQTGTGRDGLRVPAGNQAS